jgi:hypothetical protein
VGVAEICVQLNWHIVIQAQISVNRDELLGSVRLRNFLTGRIFYPEDTGFTQDAH